MLTDFHIHSTASYDAHDSMRDMALSAYSRGVRMICFTDHVDLDDYHNGRPDPKAFDNHPEMLRQICCRCRIRICLQFP